MVLESKHTTVAYRCPYCGAGVMSAVDIFSLKGDMLKLKCTCGKSELEIQYSNDGKVRIKSPCIVCPSGHTYTVSKNIFFGRDLFVLPCPISDINICVMGERERVKAELARGELELLDILEKSGACDFSALHEENKKTFTDPQITDIIMFVIRDLEAEGKIFCKCHTKDDKNCSGEKQEYNDEYGFEPERVYDVEIMDDCIKVSCPDCGYFRNIPMDSLLGAHAFLNSDALYLTKDGE